MPKNARSSKIYQNALRVESSTLIGAPSRCMGYVRGQPLAPQLRREHDHRDSDKSPPVSPRRGPSGRATVATTLIIGSRDHDCPCGPVNPSVATVRPLKNAAQARDRGPGEPGRGRGGSHSSAISLYWAVRVVLRVSCVVLCSIMS